MEEQPFPANAMRGDATDETDLWLPTTNREYDFQLVALFPRYKIRRLQKIMLKGMDKPWWSTPLFFAQVTNTVAILY